MSLKLNTKYLKDFVNADEMAGIKAQVEVASQSLHNKSGLGNDFLGWVELPTAYDKEEFARIKAAAERIKANSDILIVIGIGGSYLGARAAIELLKSPLYNNIKKDTPDIYYVGNSINPAYLNEIISLCDGKDFSVNVISKSGTTTEPALAFRIFKKMVEDKYVGGRFSVLTAVGLLPIAVAGCDIDALMKGAAKAQTDFCADFDNNDCYKYAALRNILYRKGKSVEMLVSYDPSFVMMSEWYKQLFGESEGKDNKGIFPSAAVFSTDLHSMGQYIQDGARILFETVVDIKKPKTDLFLEPDAENLDGLNFLTNQNMSVVNRKAFEGTVLAHTEGGVPNIILELDDTTEESVGYMIYFFEKACAVSGYVLGVNPFNQPGVESYKSNMFALLGKPGYEGAKAALEAKLG